jgi:predicted  nucleic acid-binding Zn-ribbon protein
MSIFYSVGLLSSSWRPLLQELQSVELAIHKLETLLKESESNGSSGRETLSSIRVDLRRIWALKREVESLEDSLKTEAGLLRKSLTAKVGLT